MSAQLKQVLRSLYKQVRSQLEPEYQRKVSHLICERIGTMNLWSQATSIALYHAVNGEIDLGALWHSALRQGKCCYFPILNPDKTLAFLPADKTTAWKTNRFGIAEPDTDLSFALSPEDIDIIFLPLLAFDSRGTRLGAGGGYYDRTLAGINHPLLAGVGYEFQHEPYIMSDVWDVDLNAIITQKTIYWARENP